MPVKFHGHLILIALPAHLSRRLQAGILDFSLHLKVPAEPCVSSGSCLRMRFHSQPLFSLPCLITDLGANSKQQFLGWRGKKSIGTVSAYQAPLWIHVFCTLPPESRRALWPLLRVQCWRRRTLYSLLFNILCLISKKYWMVCILEYIYISSIIYLLHGCCRALSTPHAKFVTTWTRSESVLLTPKLQACMPLCVVLVRLNQSICVLSLFA